MMAGVELPPHQADQPIDTAPAFQVAGTRNCPLDRGDTPGTKYRNLIIPVWPFFLLTPLQRHSFAKHPSCVLLAHSRLQCWSRQPHELANGALGRHEPAGQRRDETTHGRLVDDGRAMRRSMLPVDRRLDTAP